MKSPIVKSMQVHTLAAFLLFALFLGSCNHSSGVDTQTAIKATTSACIPNSSFKLAKTSDVADTNFVYIFSTSFLNATFTVRQYCGREANAFVVTHAIVADTITIAVTDTVQGGPWCDCLYLVNAQISGLSQNRYIVRCIFFSPDRPAGEIWHQVEVRRG